MSKFNYKSALFLTLFSVMFITSGSTYPMIVVYYFLLILLSMYIIFKVLHKGKIKRVDIFVFLCLCSWVIVPILLLGFATDATVSLLDTVFTILVTISAVFFARKVMENENAYKRLLLYFSVVYLLINFLMYVLWVKGLISYEGNNFSGIFNNRNTLAIASVYLFVIVINIKPNQLEGLVKIIHIPIILSLIFLVIVSASTKGFLSVVLVIVIYFTQSIRVR